MSDTIDSCPRKIDWGLFWRLAIAIASTITGITLSISKYNNVNFFPGYKIVNNLLNKIIMVGVGFVMGLLITSLIIIFIEEVFKRPSENGL